MDPIYITLISVIGSLLVTAVTVGLFTGKQKEKIANLEYEKRNLWKAVDLLRQAHNTYDKDAAQTKIKLNHLEESLKELKDENKQDFNKIAELIESLGEKLAEKYVQKGDMDLYLKKGI